MRKSDFVFSDNCRLFNHDFRVFIFGAEVTQHIRGSVSITRVDRQGAGTASFDLDGVGDIFLITPKNKGYIKNPETGNYTKDPNVNQEDITSLVSDSAKETLKTLLSSVDSYNSKISELNNSISSVEDEISNTTDKNKLKSLKSELNKYQNELKEYTNKLYTAKSRLNIINNVSYATNKDSNREYYVKGSFNSSDSSNTKATGSLLGRKTLYTGTKSDQIYLKGNTNLVNDSLYSDSAKRMIYINKSILNVDISFGKTILNSNSNIKPYSLAIESCILEKNDPLRIFIRDPCSPFSVDKWIPMFTGFIQNITDHVNYENGEKYFTVACYDIRGLLQKMRVMTNTRVSHGTDSAMDRVQNSLSNNAGYFVDYFAGGNLGGNKSNKYLNSRFDTTIINFITDRTTYYKKFETEFCGESTSRQSILSTQSQYTISNNNYLNSINTGVNLSSGPGPRSIGCFLPGLVIDYPENEFKEYKVKALETWFDTLVFGTKQTYWTFEEVTTVGINTMPYAEFDPYNCFLHMILPKEGTPNRRLFSSQLEDLSPGFEFKSRFEFLSETCEILDYQWFCNGFGDIVVEFPMYDFTPDYFGAYEGQLLINNHLISTSINEITDDVVTCVYAQGGVQSITGNAQAPIQFVYGAVAKSDNLAFKYGINIENFTVPYMRTDTNNTSLKHQAEIELIKRNIMATSMEIEVAYRYAIYPNKPIIQVDRNRLGITNSFSFNLEVNTSVSCGMGLFSIKKKNEHNKYINIYNGSNLPVNYAEGSNAISSGDIDKTGIETFLIT